MAAPDATPHHVPQILATGGGQNPKKLSQHPPVADDSAPMGGRDAGSRSWPRPRANSAVQHRVCIDVMATSALIPHPVPKVLATVGGQDPIKISQHPTVADESAPMGGRDSDSRSWPPTRASSVGQHRVGVDLWPPPQTPHPTMSHKSWLRGVSRSEEAFPTPPCSR